jgi:hypothetical protein
MTGNKRSSAIFTKVVRSGKSFWEINMPICLVAIYE